MKLKTEIVERIKGRNDLKRSLRQKFNVSRTSVFIWMRDNKDDGPLTTQKAVNLICPALDINPEEIFENEPAFV